MENETLQSMLLNERIDSLRAYIKDHPELQAEAVLLGKKIGAVISETDPPLSIGVVIYVLALLLEGSLNAKVLKLDKKEN